MSDQTDQNIANNVKRLRDQAGLKQAELVDRLRVNGLEDWHPTTLSRTESGERPVRLSEAVVLAHVLGVTAEELAAHYSPEGRAVDDAEGALQYVARTRSVYATAREEYVSAWKGFVHIVREVGRLGDLDDALHRRVRRLVERSTQLKPSDETIDAAMDEYETGDGRMTWEDDTVPPAIASQDGLQAR